MRTLINPLIACLVLASSGGAQTRLAPLAPFTVTSAAGVATPSTALAGDGRRLLLYVDPRSSSSEDLLGLWRLGDPSSEGVIVVARVSSVDELALVRDRHPALAGASWYADTDGTAAAAFELPGTPATVALDASTVTWTIRGLLPDREQMRLVVFDWLQGR